jgi:hypothetical protein
MLRHGRFGQRQPPIESVLLRPLTSVARSQALRHAALPLLVTIGPSVRLGASYAFAQNLVLHSDAGYTWEPATKRDERAAVRILVPGLAGQAVPVDLKPEGIECCHGDFLRWGV